MATMQPGQMEQTTTEVLLVSLINGFGLKLLSDSIIISCKKRYDYGMESSTLSRKAKRWDKHMSDRLCSFRCMIISMITEKQI